MKYWVTNRTQQEVLSGKVSEYLSVICGVQDTALGPILFRIDVDFLELGLNTRFSNFTDDSKIVRGITAKNTHRSIQNHHRPVANLVWEVSNET